MEVESKPDLNVRFTLGQARKTEVEAYPAGWRGLGTRRVRVAYTQGTLVINLRDTGRKELVWRSVAEEEKNDPIADLQASRRHGQEIDREISAQNEIAGSDSPGQRGSNRKTTAYRCPRTCPWPEPGPSSPPSDPRGWRWLAIQLGIQSIGFNDVVMHRRRRAGRTEEPGLTGDIIQLLGSVRKIGVSGHAAPEDRWRRRECRRWPSAAHPRRRRRRRDRAGSRQSSWSRRELRSNRSWAKRPCAIGAATSWPASRRRRRSPRAVRTMGAGMPPTAFTFTAASPPFRLCPGRSSRPRLPRRSAPEPSKTVLLALYLYSPRHSTLHKPNNSSFF